MSGRTAVVAPARMFLSRHPEWWILGAALAAWTALVVAPLLPAAKGTTPLEDALHTAHGMDGPIAAGLGIAGSWTLMTLAMMVPSASQDVRYVVRVSLRHRRIKATALFVAAFVCVWLPGALLASVVHSAAAIQPAAVTIGAFAAAAMWEFSPAKRHALLACRRRRSIRSKGWIADRSVVDFGLARGGSCVVSCAPAMVAMVAAGHSLIPMVIVGAALYGRKVAAGGYRHPLIAAAAIVTAGAISSWV